MLQSLAPLQHLAQVPRMVSKAADRGEDWIWGQALKTLRKAAGMTLAEAGDGVEPEGISGQAWGMYEQGQRPSLTEKPNTQRRMAKAVAASRQDLVEAARSLGAVIGDNENDAPAQGVGETTRSFVFPVQTRVRGDQDAHGGLVYDARAVDSHIDLGWMFGANAGRLRMADDRLKGRVQSGQMLIYDKTQSPRAGQVCVIETRDGGLYVYEFTELSGGSVKGVQSNPAATVEFPMAAVKGVYAVRLIGD